MFSPEYSSHFWEQCGICIDALQEGWFGLIGLRALKMMRSVSNYRITESQIAKEGAIVDV